MPIVHVFCLLFVHIACVHSHGLKFNRIVFFSKPFLFYVLHPLNKILEAIQCARKLCASIFCISMCKCWSHNQWNWSYEFVYILQMYRYFIIFVFFYMWTNGLTLEFTHFWCVACVCVYAVFLLRFCSVCKPLLLL